MKKQNSNQIGGIQFTSSYVQSVIRPEVVLEHTLQTAVQQNAHLINTSIGIVAVAILLGIKNAQIDKAKHEMKGTDLKRVQEAVQYMNRVGIGLSPVGKAWGVVINCARAATNSNELDEQQRNIFGGQQYRPLIDAQGHIDLLNAAVNTHFHLDTTGKNTKSAAEYIRDMIGSFATPDSNAYVAVLAMAQRGELTQNLFAQTFTHLRTENANPGSLNPATREAVEQFNGTNGTNGQHGHTAQARGHQDHS